ncbi:MAG: hypothetical protein CME88_14660 [Hirschia sp.]|nr:hypothetical protein [Hirschia sp.]MBF19616.1 hypothetical protein [Hirschia sp.]
MVAPGDAWAQRAVTLTAEQSRDHARIVFKWGDGDETRPSVKARIENRVLIVEFPEAITADMNVVRDNLPDWVALARLDSDGLTARFALREQDAQLRETGSIDLTALDLVREEGDAFPAAIVSPLVAERQKAKERARIAEIPPPVDFADSLEVRGSDGGGRSRVALYWSEPVSYEATVEEGLVTLSFDLRAQPDLARIHISPPEFVGGVKGENTDKGYKLFIETEGKVDVTHFSEDDTIIIVDVAGPQARKIADQLEASIEEAEEAKALLEEAERRKLAAKRREEAKALSEAVVETSDVEDVGSGHAVEHMVAEQAAVEPKSQSAKEEPVVAPTQSGPIATVAKSSTLKSKTPVQSAPAPITSQVEEQVNFAPRETQLRDDWPNPTPPDGMLELQIRSSGAEMEIVAPWSAPAPAAVFTRDPATWIVFAATAEIGIDPDAIPAGYKIERIADEQAVILRVEAPEGIIVSAHSEGPKWRIAFGPAGAQPERFLNPVREVSETGRQRIETPMVGAAGIVWFTDPMIGDEIAAAVSFGPTAASTTARNFIEADIPATAHGLAVIPHADDIFVALQEERVVVSSAKGGMAVSSNSAGITANYTAMTMNMPTPGFIDFDAWGGLEAGRFYYRKNELSRAVAARDPSSRAGADVLVELARFYIAHDLDSEALGALRMALDGRPLLEQDAGYLALRGAANVMLRRYEEAEADLSKGALRGDDSAHIWRGYVAAELGQWERANDFFKLGEELIFSYTDRWAARFYAKAAEAALQTNELDRARQLADRTGSYSERRPSEDAALVLARLAEIKEGPEEAYKRYVGLTRDVSEPVAVQAELYKLDLGVKIGKISPLEAADQLEALRFRWRGDDVEMQTVGILADQYMRLGRFREALMLAQSAALREPDARGARELRLRLMEYFRQLYLEGEADRLDPIQALALFYEFKALTPIGPDGDLMIRKLARRLVAFDLLDPATELLQHQVDNRMRGQSKASIASDLASIYLMDRQPDRALAAINASRQPRLPKEVALERRLLEAAAHRDMGRFDHAIELLEGINGKEAASIRADAFWRDRKWPQAADELASMIPPAEAASESDAPLVLKAAIAGRMAKKLGLLSSLRDGYADLFKNTENETSFDLITSQTDISGAALSEAVRRLADAPRVDAFAAALKQRFNGDTAGEGDG